MSLPVALPFGLPAAEEAPPSGGSSTSLQGNLTGTPGQASGALQARAQLSGALTGQTGTAQATVDVDVVTVSGALQGNSGAAAGAAHQRPTITASLTGRAGFLTASLEANPRITGAAQGAPGTLNASLDAWPIYSFFDLNDPYLDPLPYLTEVGASGLVSTGGTFGERYVLIGSSQSSGFVYLNELLLGEDAQLFYEVDSTESPVSLLLAASGDARVGYRILLSESTVYVYRVDLSGETLLGSGSASAVFGVGKRLRFRIERQHPALRVRVWEGAEPATWDLEVSDGTYATYYVAVDYPAAGLYRIYGLGVATGGFEAPSEPIYGYVEGSLQGAPGQTSGTATASQSLSGSAAGRSGVLSATLTARTQLSGVFTGGAGSLSGLVYSGQTAQGNLTGAPGQLTSSLVARAEVSASLAGKPGSAQADLVARPQVVGDLTGASGQLEGVATARVDLSGSTTGAPGQLTSAVSVGAVIVTGSIQGRAGSASASATARLEGSGHPVGAPGASNGQLRAWQELTASMNGRSGSASGLARVRPSVSSSLIGRPGQTSGYVAVQPLINASLVGVPGQIQSVLFVRTMVLLDGVHVQRVLRRSDIPSSRTLVPSLRRLRPPRPGGVLSRGVIEVESTQSRTLVYIDPSGNQQAFLGDLAEVLHNERVVAGYLAVLEGGVPRRIIDLSEAAEPVAPGRWKVTIEDA